MDMCELFSSVAGSEIIQPSVVCCAIGALGLTFNIPGRMISAFGQVRPKIDRLGCFDCMLDRLQRVKIDVPTVCLLILVLF